MNLSGWRSPVAALGVLIAVAILAPLLWIYLTGSDLMGCRQPDKQPSYASAKSDHLLQSNARHQSRALPQSIYKQVDCEKPGSDREYELCQQRYTAKATEEATCIARRQWWLNVAGSVLSLFGLIVLAATVWFAKEEVRASSESNTLSRQALIVDQRPWIAVDIEPAGPITWAEGRAQVSYKRTLKNIGKSPALNVWRLRKLG